MGKQDFQIKQKFTGHQSEYLKVDAIRKCHINHLFKFCDYKKLKMLKWKITMTLIYRMWIVILVAEGCFRKLSKLMSFMDVLSYRHYSHQHHLYVHSMQAGNLCDIFTTVSLGSSTISDRFKIRTQFFL